MYIVFLDEFGHIGPFVARNDPKFNTSPVFGVSGFFMRERYVRDFATWFYQTKNSIYKEDIANSGKHPSAWEKKGNEIFTKGRVHKTKRIAYTLINQIHKSSGKIFYHGIEKYQDHQQSNPTGMYYTVLSHAINALQRYFATKAQNFMIVLDEHQARVSLLESAMRTMYRRDYPAKNLLEAPYQVESHLYQTVQAADWLSAIIGPLWAYRALPQELKDRAWAEKYFAKRIEVASTHSSVRLRR